MKPIIQKQLERLIEVSHENELFVQKMDAVIVELIRVSDAADHFVCCVEEEASDSILYIENLKVLHNALARLAKVSEVANESK